MSDYFTNVALVAFLMTLVGIAAGSVMLLFGLMGWWAVLLIPFIGAAVISAVES